MTRPDLVGHERSDVGSEGGENGGGCGGTHAFKNSKLRDSFRDIRKAQKRLLRNRFHHIYQNSFDDWYVMTIEPIS